MVVMFGHCWTKMASRRSVLRVIACSCLKCQVGNSGSLLGPSMKCHQPTPLGRVCLLKSRPVDSELSKNWEQKALVWA